MKYIVKMSDSTNDKLVTMEIEAKSVFDAIDFASAKIDNPDETELVEAYPIIKE